ncbi:MAG: redox-regulated ATPase YchF [Patescibacteria group bacterium]
MLSVGLVGLPNAGKSTLFNLLTKRSVPAENFPFCTIDPNTGIVEVPDDRVHKLGRMFGSEKLIHAAIEFKDIAGLVKNASSGAGLGNQFLSHIRETDMILLVLRAFEHPDIIHVENRVNPQEDMDILLLELILSDAKQAEKQLENLQKEVKKGTDKFAGQKMEILEQIMQAFEENKMASTVEMDPDAEPEMHKWRKSLNLLTDKPMLTIANVIDGGTNQNFSADVSIDILQETELSGMSMEERIEFTGNAETGLDLLIVTCYDKLGLGTYLTAGPKESRAWTFKRGTKAPQAAAVIHSDFEARFIRGEVVKFEDLVAAGGLKQAKDQGKVQLIGKEYVVQDGDVCEWILK